MIHLHAEEGVTLCGDAAQPADSMVQCDSRDVRQHVLDVCVALEEARRAPDGRFLAPRERPLPGSLVASHAEAGRCFRCLAAAASRSCFPEEPPRLDPEALREFVVGLVEGRAFTSASVRNPGDLAVVFMPLALISPPPPRDYLERVGVVWEWVEKALPRSMNGMPIFASLRFMHVDDWTRALEGARKLDAMRKSLEV